jgi:hypothetical protein
VYTLVWCEAPDAQARARDVVGASGALMAHLALGSERSNHDLSILDGHDQSILIDSYLI